MCIRDSTKAACPKCSSAIETTNDVFACASRCGFSIPRILAGKKLSPSIIKSLTGKRRTRVLKGFVSPRSNRPFNARLLLTDDYRIRFEAEADGSNR